MRVVATAGHVDHGKSSLVRALTGTDPDRFPEEKERGLTIDLGFAFTELPSGEEVGFVDVPGHVRFVKNMLAGVGAVEVVLLVVAANEGWMPQSEEHLQIVELLGVRHGVVALTKADTADEETLELARLELDEHLAGSALAAATVVVCDAVTGRGLDELREALDAVLADAPAPVDADRPRLWVDRVFAARGDAVVMPNAWRYPDIVDVALHRLPGVTLPRRAMLHCHVGSGEREGRLRVLDEDGHFGRLRLTGAVPMAPGDRLVLRDPGRACLLY